MYMIDSNRRWAYYYDFNLVSVPADAPAFQMDTVLKNVELIINIFACHSTGRHRPRKLVLGA